MIDIYQSIRNTNDSPNIGDGELLAAQYVSLNDGSLKKVWSPCNSLAYVIRGETTWIIRKQRYRAVPGSVLFCKKKGGSSHLIAIVGNPGYSLSFSRMLSRRRYFTNFPTLNRG